MSGFSGPATRERLTATRTYYVRTDGSNSNDGLSNTAGGAFLTIQKAVDVITGLDINGFAVTVQVGDGTYTGTVNLKNVEGFSAAGNLVIQGNNGTPANVVISTAGTAVTANGIFAIWDIKDLQIQTSSGHGIFCSHASLRFGNLVFGAVTSAQLWCGRQGLITAISSYHIAGGAANHMHAESSGEITISSMTLTFDATVAFTSFADADHVGFIESIAVTITLGAFSVTGKRYNGTRNCVIYTAGGGANFFPGDVAGTVATGAVYG